MRSLEAFIHDENLVLFRKQLAAPQTSNEQRQLLLKLLAEEEARGNPDSAGHSDRQMPQGERRG